ncbi:MULTISPECIES: RNA polymerase sigma factor [unclassified Sphingobacterium]|uniref:RNA polymerase sigma factor n=1 Tax=unclassified Sphingobacterium TaxID=2609468 RepID=UPI0025DF6EC3|nr:MULTISPECIES: RNA polymerase sigma-70 factor [unclassified Sphingobacterium]
MAVYSTYADQELMLLLKQGNHAAFTEIYNRYAVVLYLHARHMLGQDEEARDVIQELFVGIWNKYDMLDFDLQLRAYLYRSVRNMILNIIRHEKVKENYLTELGTFATTEPVETDELIRYKELKRLIEKEIERMPKKMKIIFQMSRNQNLSHAEIAEQLGISKTTVKKQVSNAISQLKKKFNSSIS